MVKVEKRGKIDYELWNKIEDKYGSMVNCPEGDEDLVALRLAMNIPPEGIGAARLKKIEMNRLKREEEGYGESESKSSEG